jgi:oxygen-independent coproporphyrinogen-3 oxidase
VSLGVQSFVDALLKMNGRHHSADQAREAIARVHEAGIPSVSIDLIYGLTGQSVDNWLYSLNAAIASGADAWQLYRLRIAACGDRPGGVVGHAARKPSQYSSVDQTLLMKMLGIQLSEEAGFQQHYTRIFARSAEHISTYLHDVNAMLSDVIGIGISSWGNVGHSYLLNIGNDFPRYFAAVEGGGFAVDRGLVRNAEEEARHAFILQLKNWRVENALFHARTGKAPRDFFGETLDRLLALRLLEEDKESVSLTDRGRFYADQVVAQFASTEFRSISAARSQSLGRPQQST